MLGCDSVEGNFKTIVDNVENLNAPNRGHQDLYLTAAERMIDSSTGKDECNDGVYGTSMTSIGNYPQ